MCSWSGALVNVLLISYVQIPFENVCEFFVCELCLQVLEILYNMDLRNVLPKTESSIKMNPNELLTWSLNLADISSRYGLSCMLKLFTF